MRGNSGISEFWSSTRRSRTTVGLPQRTGEAIQFRRNANVRAMSGPDGAVRDQFLARCFAETQKFTQHIVEILADFGGDRANFS
jgi:hypothetical protein